MLGKRPAAQAQADIVAAPAAAAAAGTAAGAQGCRSASGTAVAAPVVVAAAAAGTAAGAARCQVASDTELEDLRRNTESEGLMTTTVQGGARQGHAHQDGRVKRVKSILDTEIEAGSICIRMQEGAGVLVRAQHKASSSPAKASLDQNGTPPQWH